MSNARIGLVIALAVCLLAPMTAAAAAKERRYREVARPVLPVPMPAVVREECPGLEGQVSGCYIGRDEADIKERVWANGAVFVAPHRGLFVKLHEIGHAFDATMMDASEREAYTKLRHQRDLLWTWAEGIGDTLVAGMGTPEEEFADAYAACRMGRTPYGMWEAGYGYYPTPREHFRVCRLIARAGRDVGQPVAADGSR